MSYDLDEYGLPEEPYRLKAGTTLASSLVCLLLGLLTTNLVNDKYLGFAIVFLPLVFIFNWVIRAEGSHYSFVFLLFILAHFTDYGANQGGLWGVIVFAVAVLNFHVVAQAWKDLSKAEMFLLSILVLADVAGLVLVNNQSLPVRAQDLVVFGSLLFTYLIVSDIEVNPTFIRYLVYTWCAVLFYAFLVALNQKYSVFNIADTAFFPLRVSQQGFAYDTTRASSIVNDYELFSEFSVLSFVFMVSMFAYCRSMGVNRLVVVLAIGVSALSVLLSGTRAAFLLLFFFGFLFVLLNFGSFSRLARTFLLGFMLAALVLFLGSYFGLGTIDQRLSHVNVGSLTLAGVVNGSEINRGSVFLLGFQRLRSASWLLGYGYGISYSNRAAWFFDPDIHVADFHSLYLSLPMIWGWIGGVAFVLLIITLIVKMIGINSKVRNGEALLSGMLKALIAFWVIFLVDQYKIDILRSPNYVLLTFIMLGLTTAVVKSAREPGYFE